MAEDDYENLVLARLLESYVPLPAPAEPVSAAGLARLRDNGAVLTAQRFEQAGVGPISGGRLMLCNPELLDPVLSKFGLLESGEIGMSVVYGSLGMAEAVTSARREIMIDPLTLTVRVFDPLPDENVTTEEKLIHQIVAAIQQEADPDQPIDLEGNDLHDAAARHLGTLRHAQCYGFITGMEDEDRFRAENMEVMEIDAYLLREWEREEFDIERAP